MSSELFTIFGICGTSIIVILVWIIAIEIQYRRSIPLSTIPDTPRPFGYKMHLYALKTDQTQEVAEAFTLKDPQSINWEFGFEMAYPIGHRGKRYNANRQLIFVCPPVNGWTLVVGYGVPYLDMDSTSESHSFYLTLSERFGEAQFFDSLRLVDKYTWVKAVEGTLVRGYSMTADGQIMSFGELSPAEAALGFELPTSDNLPPDCDEWPENVGFVSEKTVLRIAGSWSVNPIDFEKYHVRPALGLVGEPEHQPYAESAEA
jgi:hypothetical protein